MSAAYRPQPMETAPKDGGWVLGLVLPDGPTETDWQPWVAVTWGDQGWVDDDCNRRDPVAWVALPDPQPRATGWTPPTGTIKVAEITGKGWTSGGKPIEVPYRWQVSIEKPDGSVDEYREWWPYATREQAEDRACKWARDFGLPIKIVPLPSNVVQLRRPRESGGTLQ